MGMLLKFGKVVDGGTEGRRDMGMERRREGEMERLGVAT
jgi:hypothetical protein